MACVPATRGLAGGTGLGADMDPGARAGAARRRGAGGPNPDRARGRVKPGSGNRADQIRNGRCAAAKKKRGDKKRARAIAAVLAEIDLNPAPI